MTSTVKWLCVAIVLICCVGTLVADPNPIYVVQLSSQGAYRNVPKTFLPFPATYILTNNAINASGCPGEANGSNVCEPLGHWSLNTLAFNPAHYYIITETGSNTSGLSDALFIANVNGRADVWLFSDPSFPGLTLPPPNRFVLPNNGRTYLFAGNLSFGVGEDPSTGIVVDTPLNNRVTLIVGSDGEGPWTQPWSRDARPWSDAISFAGARPALSPAACCCLVPGCSAWQVCCAVS